MISDYYNETVVIERYTSAKDSFGQYIKTWSTVADVSCTIQTRSGDKSIIERENDIRYNLRMYCSSTEDIRQHTDRIVRGSTYYEIIALNADLRSNHLQIDLGNDYANRS